MVMKTGRDWLPVESSKLQDRRQRNCVILVYFWTAFIDLELRPDSESAQEFVCFSFFF